MQMMVLIGVALSVATLLIALSVTAGFEKDYKKALLDFNAHVLILPGEDQTFLPVTIQKTFQDANLPDVKLISITPYLYREALLIHQGVLKGVVLKGIQKSEVRSRKSEISLGRALAEKLGVQSGQEVKLLIPTGGDISAKNTKRLEVSETFRSGLYEFDSQFALIDLKNLQELFGLPSTQHGFELRLDNPEMAPLVSAALEKSLGGNVSIQNWVELNEPLFQALQLEKWVFRVLMGLMVFVSSLNLIGAVLLSIFRNQKTISILRALGLSAVQIRGLFAWQGFALGLGGILLGLALGLCVVSGLNRFHWVPLDPQIYFLEKLPVNVEPITIFIIASLSLLLVWQTSWLAAGRASAIPIREGLHGPGQ